MAVGHGIAFVGMSQSLSAVAVDRQHVEAIRDVWLTISAMLAGFGVLLLRAARSTPVDWALIVGIGAILCFSGSAGLVISAGQPFWWQHVVLGLAVAAVGWRSRTAVVPA
jgi:CHASE2 domain-containing sensor protein